MSYCNYCPCKDCKHGSKYIKHAQTINGDWICDICYTYEVCLDADMDEPCKTPCVHRPKIISEWSK